MLKNQEFLDNYERIKNDKKEDKKNNINHFD